MYSAEGGLQSERTFVKQIVQKYIPDGTDEKLVEDIDTSNNPF
jgi:hypothetical protein